jgi:hypothetical protein
LLSSQRLLVYGMTLSSGDLGRVMKVVGPKD